MIDGYTAKQFLMRVRKQDAALKNLLDEREELHTKCLGLEAIRYDKERVQTSPTADQMADLFALLEDKDREINRKIDELYAFRLRVVEMVNGLSEVSYIEVLYRRYFKYNKWEQIAADLDYDMRYVYQLHGMALEEFERKYGGKQ